MDHLMTHLVSIIILLFLLITFVQSGLDKLFDWTGNLQWLKEHFAATFMKDIVPLLLGIILILELITGIVCILGIYYLIADGQILFALWAMILGCITLLMLLFGQRVAQRLCRCLNYYLLFYRFNIRLVCDK